MHAEKQDNLTHNKNNQTTPKMTQKIELAEEDIETIFITVFCMFKN